VQYKLTEYAYEEKMLYLILNSDETFELRWVDYYSIRYGNMKLEFENMK